MRFLAIDLGTRRVGLAMSDEGGRFATPLEVIEVHGALAALPEIVGLIRKEQVQQVVLGLPLNMDDSVGPAARQVVAFGRELAQQSGRTVVYVDERLSSFEAEGVLNILKAQGQKMTRKARKERLDALAAAGFLKDFLDGKLPAIDVDKLGIK